MERTVELHEMLEARERRVQRQQVLLAQYGLPLVCFTMNIAGPVKNSPEIEEAFREGCRLLCDRLSHSGLLCRYHQEYIECTGCEGYVVVDGDAAALKALTCEVEECCALGRLFDMDVLTPEGRKLDRPAPRRCLLCGGEAKACARSRTHTVAELQTATRALLRQELRRARAETAARLASRALLYEVCTTPKPGLVDRANCGSHRDMDIFTFMDSTSALWPYFARCTAIGWDTASLSAPETLAALRVSGRQAEAEMLAATGGVNTHKGAVFTMGILCAALGRLPRSQWAEPERIAAEAAAMTQGIVERELGGLTEATARTAGQRFYLRYRISGVRGQLESGLPAVLCYGLPCLEQGLAEGRSLDEAGAATLLTLLAHTTDTNLIARSDLHTQQDTATRVSVLLDRTPYPDRAALEQLDTEFIQKNLSPGGSADLLAVCWLLHFLKEET